MNGNFVTNLVHLWQFVLGRKGRRKAGSFGARHTLTFRRLNVKSFLRPGTGFRLDHSGFSCIKD